MTTKTRKTRASQKLRRWRECNGGVIPFKKEIVGIWATGRKVVVEFIDGSNYKIGRRALDEGIGAGETESWVTLPDVVEAWPHTMGQRPYLPEARF